MTETVDQPQQSGRNFFDAIKGEKDYNREKIMREGDYINMHGKFSEDGVLCRLMGRKKIEVLFQQRET